MSLEKEQVDDWMNSGLLTEYPVHEVFAGKNWEYIELENNVACLYPFTKRFLFEFI